MLKYLIFSIVGNEQMKHFDLGPAVQLSAAWDNANGNGRKVSIMTHGHAMSSRSGSPGIIKKLSGMMLLLI